MQHFWEAAKVLDPMAESNDFYFDSVTQVKMKSWTKGRVALIAQMPVIALLCYQGKAII